MPATVHPIYRQVTRNIVRNQQIELVEVPFDPKGGQTALDTLKPYAGGDFAALVIPQPNFFGVLEDVDELTNWAQTQNMLVIALVNPTSLALLKPPGEWGDRGADIATGEGQPLGAPLAGGGPYFGFMACKQALVRQMPGRIIGRTVDKDGQPGFTFKAGEVSYEVLKTQPGLRPAPYLASRGMKWIQHYAKPGLSDDDLKAYLRQSHRIVSLGLSKKKQRELGLNQS